MRFALPFLFLSLTAQAAIENPYLYEVKKGDKVSWMLGTQHMGIDISELIQFIEPRLKISRKSYTEVLVSNERIELWAEDPERAVLSSDQVDLSKGKPLSEETRQLLKSNFRIPELLLNRLTTESCSVVALFDYHRASPRNLDYQILQLAVKLKIPSGELDTDELRARAKVADHSGKLASAWTCDMDYLASKKSRADEVVKFLAQEYREGSMKPGIDMPMEGVALRNQGWMETLIPEFTEGSVFVSVGVGHMHGPSGLIQLLRDQGFSVTRYPHPED